MSMFGKKRTPPTNPEVQEAMATRDKLIAGMAKAVAKVDRLQNELLLDEYAKAEGMRRPWR